MTREDIIRMARESGAMFQHMAWVERDLFPVFARFAALVAAAEREECARVCERLATWDTALAIVCADSIRARGEKE